MSARVRHIPGRGAGDAILGAALILGAIILVQGCRTIEGTTGFPPFYEVYDTSSGRRIESGDETLVRPFFTMAHMDPEIHRLRIALPFIEYRWGPDLDRFRVIPMIYYRRFSQPLGGDDTDWMVFPFLFAGKDAEQGNYFAIFPLGGRVRNYLWKDETDFILFPIYVRSRNRDKYSLHVLWPFYNTVWGGGWSGSRLWPFYGRYLSMTQRGELRNDRRFIGWPFYMQYSEQLDFAPARLWFSFPFYGEGEGQRVETSTFLWPLCQYYYERRNDASHVLGYIFPFHFTRGQTDVWPFFGVKSLEAGTSLGGLERQHYRQFLLWPFQRYEWAQDGLEESTRLWVLPLLWHFYYIDMNTLETRKESKFWPLYRYQRDRERVTFDCFSPLWFSREDWDRYYSRWFSIFRYRWTPAIGGWEILYGAIMYRREERSEEKIFSILGGFFECGSRQGDFTLRFLYVPLW